MSIQSYLVLILGLYVTGSFFRDEIHVKLGKVIKGFHEKKDIVISCLLRLLNLY